MSDYTYKGKQTHLLTKQELEQALKDLYTWVTQFEDEQYRDYENRDEAIKLAKIEEIKIKEEILKELEKYKDRIRQFGDNGEL